MAMHSGAFDFQIPKRRKLKKLQVCLNQALVLLNTELTKPFGIICAFRLLSHPQVLYKWKKPGTNPART
jgi:hypothetical protein